jgi:hypothetical protein
LTADNAKDMRVTQDLNSFGEIIAHAQCSVDGKKKYIFRNNLCKALHKIIAITVHLNKHAK